MGSRLKQPLWVLLLPLMTGLLSACGSGSGSTESEFTTGCDTEAVQWETSQEEIDAGIEPGVCFGSTGVGRGGEIRPTLDLDAGVDQYTGRALYQCVEGSWQLDLSATTKCSPFASTPLSLEANDGSRYYEYISDSFTEIGRPWNGVDGLDGYFSPISAGNSAGTVGAGIIQHPFGGQWAELGTIKYNDTGYTGEGYFEAPIIDILAELNTYVLGEQMITNTAYTTFFPPEQIVGGIVILQDDEVIGIEFDAVIELSISWNSSTIDYSGHLILDEDGTFDLKIGEPSTTNQAVIDFSSGVYTRLFHWDYTGTVVLPAP